VAPAPPRTVLLVHPDFELRAVLSRALAGHHVWMVERLESALPLLALAALDFVVVPHGEAKRLIKASDEAGSVASRIVLCPMAAGDALAKMVELAAQGHPFHALDLGAAIEALSANLRALVDARGLRARAPSGLQAEFELGGRSHRCQVADLSPGGLALQLDVEQAVESLLPGAALNSLTLWLDGRAILTTAQAVLRHRHAGNQGYRLGVELRPTPPPPDAGAPTGDPVRIQAMLRRAAHRASPLSLQLQQPTCPVHVRLGPGWSMEAAGVRCQAPPGAAVRVGDVGQLSFDLAGQSWQGTCVVVQQAEDLLILAPPRVLVPQHRRRVLRFSPPTEAPFALAFTSPLDGQRALRPVLDLSTHGLSFAFDGAQQVLLPGLRLDDCELVLPDGSRSPCQAQVMGVTAHFAEGNPSHLRPFRCGVRLENSSGEGTRAVLDAFVATRCKELVDGGQVPFKDLWDTFGEQFYHPDYPQADGPHLAALEQTHLWLTSAPHALAKTLVYRDGERLLGHANGVLFYSRTWMGQHLAVVPGYFREHHISHHLSTLVVEYLEAFEEVEFVRYSWRTTNRWPNRLFRWMERMLRAQGLSRIHDNHYTRLAFSEGVLPRTEGLPEVCPASKEARVAIERHLRATDQLLRLSAEDLCAEEIDLHRVDERWAPHGLRRRREVFAVEDGDGPVAVALAESATEGLTLPEHANGFQLLTLRPDHPHAALARAALIARAVRHYQALGRPSAICLASDGDLEALALAGFRYHMPFSHWTFHRSLLRAWYHLFCTVFERTARRRAPKHRAAPSDEEEPSP
jgi:hypothetical protein